MANFDWKALVSVVAPTLGTALGGPLAGAATSAISTALLGKPTASDKELTKVLEQTNPDQLAALAAAEAQFTSRLKELDVDVFKLETADRQSARAAAKDNLWPQIALSGLFLGGYFTLLVLLFTTDVKLDGTLNDLMLILAGILTREVPTIMQFWFGSSFGSKEKNKYMDKKLT
jgi:hypothetical protein